jgi:P2-related tail formation protein
LKNIFNADYESLLPQFLKNDTALFSLSRALSNQLKFFALSGKMANIYSHIEFLPDEILDRLAQDFNVSWYNQLFSHSEKVKIISEMIKVFKYLGTPYALKTALESIFSENSIEVSEWYNYGGIPYFFKIKINVANVSVEKQILALEKIDYFKNARSILEALVLFIRPENSPKLYAGGTCSALVKKIMCVNI